MTQTTAQIKPEDIGLGRAVACASPAAPPLLDVLEEIATSGPITISQIARRLSLREAVVRQAASALERRDWVWARVSDHAFEISPKIDEFFASAHVAPPETGEFRQILGPIAASQRMSATIGAFTANGEFCAVDATTPRVDLRMPRSLIFDHLALAAQSVLGPSTLHRHLTAFREKLATPDEVAIISAGGHADNLRQIQEDGFIWSEARDGFAVPLRFATGAAGAVQFDAIPELEGTQTLFFHEFARRLRGSRMSQTPGIEARELCDLLTLSLEFDDFIYDPREA